MTNPFERGGEPTKKKGQLTRTTSSIGDPESQIMTFVTPKLDETEWGEIGTYLHTVIMNATRERSQLDANLVIWNDMYEGLVPEGKDFPWPDSSNLHIPLTQEMLDAVHSRLSKSTLGVNPLVLVKGQDQEGVDLEYKLERYYEVLSDAVDLADVIGQAIFLALRDGVGLLKVMWERRTRKVKTRKMKPMLDPETGQPIMDPTTGKPVREEAVEIDDVTEYDNARCYPVELKDFYLLPSHAYGMEKQYARGVAERVWMRWDQLYVKAKSGEYDMEGVMRLKSTVAGSRLQVTGSTANLEVDTISGQVQISVTPGLEEHEVFEIYMSYDLDGDGYDEECVFTYVPKFNTLLRAEVFPYWHQLRPYVAFIPWPRPRRFYGFSVPQRLESVNRELNAIHNQRLDAVSLRLSPPLIITRSAILRGDASQPWGPAARFEVNETTDVQPINLPDIIPSSFSEENILRQYAERIIGIFDVNTPRGTGSRRTRAEIGAIQQESLVRFDYMMKLVKRSVVKVFEQIHQLKIQYMPDEETFEAVGIDGVQKFTISRQEMLANVKFLANGDLPVADQERNRQEAYFLYGALLQNPLVASRPDRIFAVTKILLEAWDRKDVEKIIGTFDEIQQQMQMQAQAQAGAQPGQPGQPGAQPEQQMGMIRGQPMMMGGPNAQTLGAGPKRTGTGRGV